MYNILHSLSDTTDNNADHIELCYHRTRAVSTPPPGFIVLAVKAAAPVYMTIHWRAGKIKTMPDSGVIAENAFSIPARTYISQIHTSGRSRIYDRRGPGRMAAGCTVLKPG